MNTAKYKNLLSPISIRGHIIKNRMESSNSSPHFLQGPEPYPADGLFTHYVNRAKSGAAIVTISGINTLAGMPENLSSDVDVSHFPDFNLYDSKCQNYLIQLTEAIHFYGAVVSVGLFTAGAHFPIQKPNGEIEMVSGLSIPAPTMNTEAPSPQLPEGALSPNMLQMLNYVTDDLPIENMEKIAESFAQQAGILQRLGFDMVTLHMAYRAQLLGQFFSPLTNKRTDEYGVTLEGRAKFPLMVLRKIRERTGNNFIIEVQLSGEEDGGYTKEDALAFLRMADGLIDIAQIRYGEGDDNHPTGLNLEATPFLSLAEYFKKSGVPMQVASVGGYQDPDLSEKAIAEGKIDIVSMARAWISNPSYGRLVEEGRREDIVPCLRCNKCHGRGENDPFASVCSVNPTIGLEHHLSGMILPVMRKKRVAIIGGGPAGMRCALDLYDRGHTPVIYEKKSCLGGALCHADYADFKWPLRDYKDYLIRQVNKRGIEVHCNTEISPQEIAVCGYDVVVAALGAVPTLPPIKGLADADPVFYQKAFAFPETLGENVVIIGGGEIGVEIGMYLSRKGHHATVLEMREKLAADATKIHYYSMLEAAWKKEPLFCGVTGVHVQAVAAAEVIYYYSRDGKEYTVPYDSLVVAAGSRPLQAEAMAFRDCAPQFFVIGDCQKPASVQQATRAAYGTACQI